MTDTSEANGNPHYRMVISRDGPWWVGRTYGRYLPEEGVTARSRTLAGLRHEAHIHYSEARERELGPLQELPEWIASEAAWRGRQLALIASDKLRERAESRRVSRT